MGDDKMSALLQIKLVTVSDVALFNATCNSVNCKTILRSDCYVVDAKSLMGIFSLDLSKPVTLEISDDKFTSEFSEWTVWGEKSWLKLKTQRSMALNLPYEECEIRWIVGIRVIVFTTARAVMNAQGIVDFGAVGLSGITT